jgi:hypothetical protein
MKSSAKCSNDSKHHVVLPQHYFIDRDGKMFRHVLNFLRTSALSIPESFDEIELLCDEVKFYEIQPLARYVYHHEQQKKGWPKVLLSSSFILFVPTFSQLEQLRMAKGLNGNLNSAASNNCSPRSTSPVSQAGSVHQGKQISGLRGLNADGRHQRSVLNRKHADGTRGWDTSPGDWSEGFQCIALSISPDLGERLLMSGERTCIIDIFPEITANLMDPRSGVAWNQDPMHVVRFPLNGYCKIISLQAISRILSHGFKIAAATGGGTFIDGQQLWTEYLFTRPLHAM